METLLDKDLTEIEKRDLRLQIAEKYNWLTIAEQTIEVYKKSPYPLIHRLPRLNMKESVI